MAEPLNPYATPGQGIIPGWYVLDVRRLTLGERIRITKSVWMTLVVTALTWSDKPMVSTTCFHLPNWLTDHFCPPEEVPAAIRDALSPLIAVATAAGFTLKNWGRLKHEWVEVANGAAYFYDGRGTMFGIVIMKGVVEGQTVDATSMSFDSFERGTGRLFTTTNEGNALGPHPRARNRVMKGAGFADLLRVHLRRTAGGDFACDYADFLRLADDIIREGKEARVRRGLYRFVANTREEAERIVAQAVPIITPRTAPPPASSPAATPHPPARPPDPPPAR
jgi:hypothetical protein